MTEESAFEADPLHFALAVLRLVVAEELVVREAVYGQSLAGLNKFLALFPLRGSVLEFELLEQLGDVSVELLALLGLPAGILGLLLAVAVLLLADVAPAGLRYHRVQPRIAVLQKPSRLVEVEVGVVGVVGGRCQ